MASRAAGRGPRAPRRRPRTFWRHFRALVRRPLASDRGNRHPPRRARPAHRASPEAVPAAPATRDPGTSRQRPAGRRRGRGRRGSAAAARGPVSRPRTRATATATRGVVVRERQERRRFARACRRRPGRTREDPGGAAPSARRRVAPRGQGRPRTSSPRPRPRRPVATNRLQRQRGNTRIRTASGQRRLGEPGAGTGRGNRARQRAPLQRGLAERAAAVHARATRGAGRRAATPAPGASWSRTSNAPRTSSANPKSGRAGLSPRRILGGPRTRAALPSRGSANGPARLARPALWPTQPLLYGLSGSL